VSVNILAISLGKFPRFRVVHHEIVVQLPALKVGMSDFDSRIEDSDAHSRAVRRLG
jgi:hypothetical protein